MGLYAVVRLVAGPYQCRVDASLEDVSGNTPWAPFDADAGTDIVAPAVILSVALASRRRLPAFISTRGEGLLARCSALLCVPKIQTRTYR